MGVAWGWFGCGQGYNIPHILSTFSDFSTFATFPDILSTLKSDFLIFQKKVVMTKCFSQASDLKIYRPQFVLLPTNLTWSIHIDQLCKKLLKRIAVLARVTKYVSTRYRLMLYNASIKPLFEYCCSVWSNCSQGNIDDLFKLQKRCARLILDNHPALRSFENFKELEWLPIDHGCLL